MFAALREDIHSVFERDPAARSVWEVLTSYPGLHARTIHRVANWFWRNGGFWPVISKALRASSTLFRRNSKTVP